MATKGAQRAGEFEGHAPHCRRLLWATSDIISNLFLEGLDRIWELKKWIPDPCNPHFHYLKSDPEEEI